MRYPFTHFKPVTKILFFAISALVLDRGNCLGAASALRSKTQSMPQPGRREVWPQ